MRLYWIWLSLRQGMSEQECVRALSYFGSPEDCYYADAAACGNVEGLRSSAVEASLDKDLTEAEKILLACEKQKIKILAFLDAHFQMIGRGRHLKFGQKATMEGAFAHKTHLCQHING